MYADIILPGVGYHVLGQDQKRLSFEILEQSRGDVSPRAIKKAKEILAKRKIQSDIMNTEHKRFYSKIIK